MTIVIKPETRKKLNLWNASIVIIIEPSTNNDGLLLRNDQGFMSHWEFHVQSAKINYFDGRMGEKKRIHGWISRYKHFTNKVNYIIWSYL